MDKGIFISPVRQFVRENISEFRNTQRVPRRFELTDNNGNYRGEYFLSRNSLKLGNLTSLSNLRIIGDNLKPVMQENVWTRRQNVNIEDFSKGVDVVVVPKLITRMTTMLDYLNDSFKTVRTLIELKNPLERIDKDDKYFKFSDRFILFKPLEDKMHYETTSEVVNTGRISQVKSFQDPHKESNQYPYIFW